MEKKLGALGGVFLFGGFLLVFGAVGGMDNPEQADYFWQQTIAAVIGLFWMWVGTRLIRE